MLRLNYLFKINIEVNLKYTAVKCTWQLATLVRNSDTLPRGKGRRSSTAAIFFISCRSVYNFRLAVVEYIIILR